MFSERITHLIKNYQDHGRIPGLWGTPSASGEILSALNSPEGGIFAAARGFYETQQHTGDPRIPTPIRAGLTVAGSLGRVLTNGNRAIKFAHEHKKAAIPLAAIGTMSAAALTAGWGGGSEAEPKKNPKVYAIIMYYGRRDNERLEHDRTIDNGKVFLNVQLHNGKSLRPDRRHYIKIFVSGYTNPKKKFGLILDDGEIKDIASAELTENEQTYYLPSNLRGMTDFMGVMCRHYKDD